MPTLHLPMPSSLPSSHVRLAVALCGLALGLGFVPPAQVSRVRAHVYDALQPGLECLQAVTLQWDSAWQGWSFEFPHVVEGQAAEIAQLTEQLQGAKLRARQLEIDNARLHQQLKTLAKTGTSPYPILPGQPLVKVELLEAAVLTRDHGAIWPAERILNRGSEDGLAETDLVLDAPGPLIDQGTNAELATGQPVYSGRCVVGRLANVGRVASTIQHVTDENYRGYAQLVRQTERGFVFGAEGVLEGTGEALCRLRYVAATEPVEVGDKVYTKDHDGSQPYPTYYGQVVRAELNPGDQEWSIWVEPVIQKIETPTVTVLRTRLDPARRLTN